MYQYKIGISLSGGSIKGFAHLGVLKFLDENQIRPRIIAGTSAGALMGAFYADGYSPAEIFELLSSISFLKMTSFSPTDGGLFNTSKFVSYLRKHLRHHRIEELPIPMRIVATDIDAGKQCVFTSGNLPDIITASCSIPILFRPMTIEGVSYVDGGLFRNFPVSVIRDLTEQIIGVNLGPEPSYQEERGLVSVAQRSWQLVFGQNTRMDKALCDYLLETEEVLKYGLFEVSSAQEIMDIGYRLAQEVLSPHLDKLRD